MTLVLLVVECSLPGSHYYHLNTDNSLLVDPLTISVHSPFKKLGFFLIWKTTKTKLGQETHIIIINNTWDSNVEENKSFPGSRNRNPEVSSSASRVSYFIQLGSDLDSSRSCLIISSLCLPQVAWRFYNREINFQKNRGFGTFFYFIFLLKTEDLFRTKRNIIFFVFVYIKKAIYLRKRRNIHGPVIVTWPVRSNQVVKANDLRRGLIRWSTGMGKEQSFVSEVIEAHER